MNRFTEISPEQIQGNMIEMISKEWMLITAQKDERVNMMTASWGGVGFMWGKPVAVTAIRPQRFTHDFVTAADTFSLDFFDDVYRSQLNLCGTTSGRDTDKVAACEFTVLQDGTTPYFEQAKLVLFCKKLHVQELAPAGFMDGNIPAMHYPQADFHTLYISEITKVLKK